ncbi:YppG family protein [Virgibacillus ndiopensis]|uniref:YppG family protein n=1 Tax=Virgibacillus ndiopensis TaxID=2004408 RepID=UPI000C081B67|nr:YppG family protein [Virgibacillus ndiopensis]
MFNRPYYYNDPFQYNTYHGNFYMHPQQGNYSQYQPQNPPIYKTPFEHFAKPKQPNDWYVNMQPNLTPYPPQKTNGLFSYFQDKNGQMDLDKMFSTVGKLANTVQQVSPVVKQFGSIMKNM